MDLRKGAWVALILVLSILPGCIPHLNKVQPSLAQQHLTVFEDMIYSLDDGEYALNAIIPFDWDAMYSFSPYTSKEEITSAIGFESDIVYDSYDEAIQQIIFVKDREIVCSIYGSVVEMGYQFHFPSDDHYDREVKKNENFSVTVLREEDFIQLKLSGRSWQHADNAYSQKTAAG